MKKLNLGCGGDYKAGYVNVDSNLNYRIDVVHDLNVYPYPLISGEYSEIIASHIIEHLDNPIKFLQELYRLGANGAIIHISCPHFSGNWMHPLHKSAISSKLFSFADSANSENYGNMKFELLSVRLSWLRLTGLGKRANILLRGLNFVINFFANFNLAIVERIWCYWVGGFEEIKFMVKVVK